MIFRVFEERHRNDAEPIGCLAKLCSPYHCEISFLVAERVCFAMGEARNSHLDILIDQRAEKRSQPKALIIGMRDDR